MRRASCRPAAGHAVPQVGWCGRGWPWQVEGVAGDAARRARCQASSCSRRRAGGGPGAPRGPAAADANLCPPAQQAAGGRGRPPPWWGGGVGTAGPPRLTWHCRLLCCSRTRSCGHRLCRDRLSRHVGTLPPTCHHHISAVLISSRFLSVPPDPHQPEHPCNHAKECSSPPMTQCPHLPSRTSPTADCSLPLRVPAQPNLLIAPNASIPQTSNSLPRSISQPSIPPEIPHHSIIPPPPPSPLSIPTPSVTPTPHIPSKYPLGIPHLLL